MQQLELANSEPSELLVMDENIHRCSFLPPDVPSETASNYTTANSLHLPSRRCTREELVDKADEVYEINYNNAAIGCCEPPQAAYPNTPWPEDKVMSNQISEVRKEMVEIKASLRRINSSSRCKSRPRRKSASPRRKIQQCNGGHVLLPRQFCNGCPQMPTTRPGK